MTTARVQGRQGEASCGSAVSKFHRWRACVGLTFHLLGPVSDEDQHALGRGGHDGNWTDYQLIEMPKGLT